MKKIAFTLSAAFIIAVSSCGDNSSKSEGGDQVDEPVMNSGSNTEGERATDAVADSANAVGDSTVERNNDAMSSPH